VYHLYLYDPRIQEYKLARENCTPEFRQNFMRDPAWLNHDFEFVGF
jgi:hypothetical protein